MKFTGSSLLLAGAALLSTASTVAAEGFAQAHVKPLVVKAGGLVTVTVNVVLSEIEVRRLELMDEVIIRCTTTEDGQGYDTYPLNTINSLNKTHSDKDTKDKFADQDTVTLHSSKLWPQTWKPRLSAEETAVNELTWTLPTDGLVLNKEYKVSYKIRVGKGVEPGTVVDIPVMVDGPGINLDDVLEVQVK